jgi:hypothetical protein
MKRHDLPAEYFPFTIEAINPATGQVVWFRRVDKPDGVLKLEIPPLARQLGHPVSIRLVFADGSVEEGGELLT